MEHIHDKTCERFLIICKKAEHIHDNICRERGCKRIKHEHDLRYCWGKVRKCGYK